MIFKKIIIDNFLSIGKVDLNLNEQGNVLITGENGNGKSAIFEAMLWCLYGKTMRGLVGDDVIHRKETWTRVRVLMRDDENKLWEIERARQKGKAELDIVCEGKNVSGQTATQTQSKIESLLGFDFNSFSCSIVFSQESLKFASMTDKEKKEVLEKILGLEIYQKAQDKIRKEMAGLKMVLELAKANLSHTQNRFGQMMSKRDDLLNELLKEGHRSNMNVAKIRTQIISLQTELDKKAKTLANEEDRSVEIQKIEDTVESLEYELKVSDTAIEHHEKQIRILKKGKICSECKQEIGSESQRDFIRKHEKKLMAIREDRKNYFNRCTIEKQRVESLRKDQFTEKRKKQISDSYNDIRGKIEDLKVQLGIERKTNSYLPQLIKEAESDIKKAESEMGQAKEDISKAIRRMELREYLDKAFSPSGIRSYLLDDVVPFLNHRAKHYSTILTKGNISIRFSTITRLRNNSVVDKFGVEIENKHGAMNYQGNSAGEKQRIDLCVSLALKDLARSRGKTKINFMAFDEVFERVDEKGCEGIVELLAQEAESLGSCFVITHNDNLKQYFGNQINMVKEKGKSVLAG